MQKRKPIIKKKLMCFSFKKICEVIAVKSGVVLTITLTFEAVVKLIAMFSVN